MMLKRIIWGLVVIGSCYLLFLFARHSYYNASWWPKQGLPRSEYGCISDIAVPDGYERMRDDGSGYADFMRSLPLDHPDSVVRVWDGTVADTIVPYCYRVIDLPLISKYEQCADVGIRLNAEYLFHQRRFDEIHYDDTRYQMFSFEQGNRRAAFETYLKGVFLLSNTESMIHAMPARALKDIRPGDVFVYDSKLRKGAKYGHAITVADVAIDPTTGKKICLLVQGSTPACSIHVLSNRENPELSPWFAIDTAADTLDFGFAKYLPDELRYFSADRTYADSLKAQAMSVWAERLVSAYPEQKLSYKEGNICFPDGTSLPFDDGQPKFFVQRLKHADLEDMLSSSYDTVGTPGFQADAGRIRNEDFFKKMYGSSQAEVEKLLVEVEWFGQTLKMISVNGVANQLRKVAEELARYPELEPYLHQASTTYWCKVRKSDQLSAHSFGIAIDINVEYSNYWKWTNPEASETEKIGYENRIPLEIVQIFERYGFIWGGRWYHYDTMHFEFRPEILSNCI